MSDGRITIGNVEVIGVCDVGLDFFRPLDDLFPTVSYETWEPYRQRYPAVFGATPMTWHIDFGCYLLNSQGRTVLVDTGIGPAYAPYAAFLKTPGHLLDKFPTIGVDPNEVEAVIFTHLHPDHIGWNLVREDGSRRLAFPRARYIMHQADWEAFHRPEAQADFPFSFVDEVITPVQALGALDLATGDRRITDEITAIHTPGHTPGSMTVLISSAGEKAIIWGDVLVHPAQISEPDWRFVYDMDEEGARRTRNQLLDRAETESMVIAACHFPDPGYGRIVRLDGRRYWRSL